MRAPAQASTLPKGERGQCGCGCQRSQFDTHGISNSSGRRKVVFTGRSKRMPQKPKHFSKRVHGHLKTRPYTPPVPRRGINRRSSGGRPPALGGALLLLFHLLCWRFVNYEQIHRVYGSRLFHRHIARKVYSAQYHSISEPLFVTISNAAPLLFGTFPLSACCLQFFVSLILLLEIFPLSPSPLRRSIRLIYGSFPLNQCRCLI